MIGLDGEEAGGLPARQPRESRMPTNRIPTGRRTGAVMLAMGALLALAVSPAFAHTNVTSSDDARHALLAAEQVGAERDQVDQLDQLDENDQVEQGNVDEVDAGDAGDAGDQGDTGDQGDSAAPRQPGGHLAESHAKGAAGHATKNDHAGKSDDQADNDDDQADENDDHEQSGDSSDDSADSGDTGNSGGGGDSGESGD